MRVKISSIQAIANQQQFDMPIKKSTLLFNGTGREKNPAWSNRFTKDFNDLEYNVRYSQIKGKGDFTEKNLCATSHTWSARSLRSTFTQSKTSRIKTARKQTRMQMLKVNKKKNPQIVTMYESTHLPPQNTNGLSVFQFKNTISGNLQYRSHSHLDFGNQTQRYLNINKVWYDKDKGISAEKLKIFKKNQCHNFESYTPRKVFQVKEKIDKIYDTEKALRLTTPQSTKSLSKLQNREGRKQPRHQVSIKLSYNQYQARKKVMNRISSYPISTLKRQLQFSRQVISPQRGCYR